MKGITYFYMGNEKEVAYFLKSAWQIQIGYSLTTWYQNDIVKGIVKIKSRILFQVS